MKILFTSKQFAPGLPWEKLAQFMPGHEIVTCKRDEIITSLSGVDVVVPLGNVINREIMARGQFGLIQQFGVGLEKIDLVAASELGIWVVRTPAYATANAASVAELAIMFMLTLSRQFNAARSCFAERNWTRPVGTLLQGKTACIVGVGATGTALASRLSGFDLRLIGLRRDKSKAPPAGINIDNIFAAMFDYSQTKEALGQSDYVVLCALYDSSNHHLFNRETIAAMKPGSFLVNVARGGLIDHEALYAALLSKHLAGAGLDVFWQEPVDPHHPLFALANVIAMPHVGGLTNEHYWTGGKELATNILRFGAGEAPLFAVNAPTCKRDPQATPRA